MKGAAPPSLVQLKSSHLSIPGIQSHRPPTAASSLALEALKNQTASPCTNSNLFKTVSSKPHFTYHFVLDISLTVLSRQAGFGGKVTFLSFLLSKQPSFAREAGTFVKHIKWQ